MQVLEAYEYAGQGTIDGEVVVGHGQVADVTRRGAARQVDAALDVSEHLVALLQEQPAGLGQRHMAGGAQEQLRPQFAFQGLDQPAQGGLGDEQGVGGTLEMQQFGNGDERLHLLEIEPDINAHIGINDL
ncbi:hypothetical protein D3C80_1713670 [compost metagenome]